MCHGFCGHFLKRVVIHHIHVLGWRLCRLLIIRESIRAGEVRHTACGILLELVLCHDPVGLAPFPAVIQILVYRKGFFIQYRMGVRADGNRIVSGFQYVTAVFCLDCPGIIRSHVFFRNLKGNTLGSPRLQHLRLAELDQVSIPLLL